MEPSEEIRRILDRWLVAFRDGECDTYVARISEHAGVLVVGTDEDEWWHQGDVGVLEQQFEESGGFRSVGVRSRRGRRERSAGPARSSP